jgi:hypothetical protein
MKKTHTKANHQEILRHQRKNKDPKDLQKGKHRSPKKEEESDWGHMIFNNGG